MGSASRARRVDDHASRHDTDETDDTRPVESGSPFRGDHENDLIGIGLIVGGVLLALAFFFDLAGPVGRGLEALVGGVIGLGRFVAALCPGPRGRGPDP